MAKKVPRPAGSWTFVLAADRTLPDGEQSRFTVSPLTITERAIVRDEIARIHTQPDGSKSIISQNRRQGVEIALHHIVSIENFPVGEPQPWPKGNEERLRYLEMLGDDSVQEIGNEIWTRSELGNDLKNS